MLLELNIEAGTMLTYRGRAAPSSKIDVTKANSHIIDKITGWRSSWQKVIIKLFTEGTQLECAAENIEIERYNVRVNWGLSRERYLFVMAHPKDITTKLRGAVAKVKFPSKVRNKQWSEDLQELRTNSRTLRKFYYGAVTIKERHAPKNLSGCKENVSGRTVESKDTQMDPWGMPKVHSPAVLSTLLTNKGQ